MKGGAPKVKESDPDTGNLDESEIVTNQEASAVPWFAGERKFALHWVTPIYKQFTRDSPTPTGKK